jgi:SAM-dependent methyltransferase
MSDSPDPLRWPRYYQAVQGRAPRPIFTTALAAFRATSHNPVGAYAIDLGCGDGTETIALLAAGWHVLAIDQEPAAIERVLASVPAAFRPQLSTQVAGFEAVVLPAADFIYAGLSLPFCTPAAFPLLWAQIETALRPGGRFAGHFFGERDSWASDPTMTMTFHTKQSLIARFGTFKIEVLNEVENDRPTALGQPKHWHIFEVVAQRPA